MNANLSGAFEGLMNSDVWIRAGAVTAGYFAPSLLRSTTQGFVPDAIDYPETYGLAVMAGGQMAPSFSREITAGGGVHVVENLAERANIKSTIVNGGA